MRSAIQLKGLLHRVDPVAREIQVVIGGRLTTFHVSPECAISLNRERVKLRLLQPLDPVKLDGHQTPSGLVLESIRVGWDIRAAASERENETAAGNV